MSAAIALLRTTSGDAGATAAAPIFDAINPAYQPPNAVPAPAASMVTRIGVATSHAIAA
ncbi:MAG: hypothetical protein ABSD52_02190 [Candidatus Cybelea sp.]